MRQARLTHGEQAIERALIRGEYSDVGKGEFDEIAQAVAHRRKDAVLNIRINSSDLRSLKAKARGHGIRYQTFIAELLHRVAHS